MFKKEGSLFKNINENSNRNKAAVQLKEMKTVVNLNSTCELGTHLFELPYLGNIYQ